MQRFKYISADRYLIRRVEIVGDGVLLKPEFMKEVIGQHRIGCEAEERGRKILFVEACSRQLICRRARGTGYGVVGQNRIGQTIDVVEEIEVVCIQRPGGYVRPKRAETKDGGDTREEVSSEASPSWNRRETHIYREIGIGGVRLHKHHLHVDVGALPRRAHEGGKVCAEYLLETGEGPESTD